jgi:putative DNA primase/helicase
MKDGIAGLDRVAKQNNKRRGKQTGAAPQPMLPSPSMPMQVAREFVADCCLHDGVLTIRYWCGCWWMWRTTHWAEALPHTVRALLYAFTENAQYLKAGKNVPELTDWSPDRRKIGDLLEALSSIVILSDDYEQPCWIDGRETGPIVATSNGLLDVASLELHPHSPLYFGQVSVPFPYDPKAAEPTKWLVSRCALAGRAERHQCARRVVWIHRLRQVGPAQDTCHGRSDARR